MKASDALSALAHQVADLESEVARLTKACAAADARAFEATRSKGTVTIKPALVVLRPEPATLQDKVSKYLGLPPYNIPGNTARNNPEFLKELDREYGPSEVDAAIKILRKA